MGPALGRLGTRLPESRKSRCLAPESRGPFTTRRRLSAGVGVRRMPRSFGALCETDGRGSPKRAGHYGLTAGILDSGDVVRPGSGVTGGLLSSFASSTPRDAVGGTELRHLPYRRPCHTVGDTERCHL